MMSHPYFVYWARLSECLCSCLTVGVCTEGLKIERVEGLEKASLNPYLVLPLIIFFPFSSQGQPAYLSQQSPALW